MTWDVTDDEFQGLLNAGSQGQYDYFVSKCADWGEVWGLAVDGTDWAQSVDDEGRLRFAVWPHQRYAEACRQSEWEHREPTSIDVHEFVDGLLSRLIEEDTEVAVFPLPDGRFTPVTPEKLRRDLADALERIE
jgi:hypothetical protein